MHIVVNNGMLIASSDLLLKYDNQVYTNEQCKNYDYLSKWKNGVNKGCRIEGHLSISKVQGHIFIVPARINDYLPLYQLQQIYPFMILFFYESSFI